MRIIYCTLRYDGNIGCQAVRCEETSAFNNEGQRQRQLRPSNDTQVAKYTLGHSETSTLNTLPNPHRSIWPRSRCTWCHVGMKLGTAEGACVFVATWVNRTRATCAKWSWRMTCCTLMVDGARTRPSPPMICGRRVLLKRLSRRFCSAPYKSESPRATPQRSRGEQAGAAKDKDKRTHGGAARI